jgi:putative acetyltransferase
MPPRTFLPLAQRIDAYQPFDTEALLAIWLAASRIGHPFLSEEDLTAQYALVRDVYLSNAETWVIRCGDEIGGFIGLLDNFIGGLFIRPTFHGTGLGRALIEHAAHHKGKLAVEAYEANLGAISFYKRCGFVEVGRRDRDDEGRALPLIRLEQP